MRADLGRSSLRALALDEGFRVSGVNRRCTRRDLDIDACVLCEATR